MKKLGGVAGIVGLVASALWVSAPALAAAPTYHLLTKIALPASPNGGDVVAYDPGTNDVYVAWGGGGLAVINTATNKLLAVIKGIQKPNGVTFSSKYVFVADGKANNLVVISKKTWTVVATKSTTAVTATATNPDSVVYDPTHHQVFVTLDNNNTVQVYQSSAPFGLKTTINLNLVVPNASIDNVGPDLASLDVATNTFYESDGPFLLSYNSGTYQNTGKLNMGLTLMGANGKLVQYAGLKDSAESNGKVFVGGNGTQPPAIMVANPALTKEVARIAVPASSDQVAVNPNTGILYGFAAGLSGQGGFFMVNTATDQYVGSVVTGGHTHTGTVVPATGDVYLLASGNPANPATNVLVYAPTSAPAPTPTPTPAPYSAVPKATSPVTGVPTLPLVGGAALVVLGAAVLVGQRVGKRST